MADQERTPATSAGENQVELEHGDVRQENAGPTAAESPTPGDEGAERTTAAPPAPEDDDASELSKRLKHLTEAPKPEQPEETSTKEPGAAGKPVAEAAEQDGPKGEKPKEPPELPEDVRKRMPKEASKAFAEIRTSLKESRAEAERIRAEAAEAAPMAEFGRSLLESVGPAFKDLQALDDAEIREAIQERAAIKRGERPKPGTIPQDLVAKLTTALDAADESLDLSEVRKLLATAAGTAAPAGSPQSAQPAAPATGQQAQPERQDTAPNRDAVQVLRTRNALLSDGVQPAQLSTYVQGRLIPAVLADLKTAFPGQNPAQVFNRLDAADRHDLLLDKHRLIQVQTKTQAKPKQAPNPQRNPLNNGTGGRVPAGGPPTSANLTDRLNYLTGQSA